MMSKIYLSIVAVLYLALAGWCTLQPEVTSSKVGFELTGGSGQSEFMTVYGGLEFGLAAVLFASMLRTNTVRFGVEACVLIHVSLVVFRTLSFFVFDQIDGFTYRLAIGEWVIALLGILILCAKTERKSDKKNTASEKRLQMPMALFLFCFALSCCEGMRRSLAISLSVCEAISRSFVHRLRTLSLDRLRSSNLILWVLATSILAPGTSCGQEAPTFLAGEDPKPAGQRWTRVEKLSDEFDGLVLDEKKWQNTDPTHWIGRAPGIFKKDAVSVEGGQLLVTNYLLPQPENHNDKRFTHAGGQLTSVNSAQVGYYFETRMKANKTFMSSTFWLINKRNEQEGCDRRVTELDIQECVGRVTTEAKWAQDHDKAMHSNTHSRNVSCGEPVGTRGGHALLGGKASEKHHVYGAWWKSPNEILFFLDGKFAYRAQPVADFDIEMYIKLVTETYDWNPPPKGGGMDGSPEQRTTSYDWVRTWKLSPESAKPATTNQTGS